MYVREAAILNHISYENVQFFQCSVVLCEGGEAAIIYYDFLRHFPYEMRFKSFKVFSEGGRKDERRR